VLVRISKFVTAITILAVFAVGTAWCQAAKKKEVKDRAEYDLYVSVTKETNDAKRLEYLNTWKEKYPDSAFKLERLQYYLNTYKNLNNGAKMLDTAKQLTAEDPKNLTGLYWQTLLTVSLANPAPEALDAGEKAANSLIANLDANKPAGATDEAWKKEKATLEGIAHTTLGWAAMQRKNSDAAEKSFAAALDAIPNNAQVDYWMGATILAGRKAERQAEALFYFARAAAMEGPGALAGPAKEKAVEYFTKLYTTYHGDASGIEDIKKYAAANPKPGADFKLLSKHELANIKDQEFAKSNPQLALWMRVKNELAAANGEQYFAGNVKDTALPPLKGRVISHKPAKFPKEIVVGIEKADVAEITLKLENPPKGAVKADPGTEIEFEGTPVAFTREPFNLTVEVAADKLKGWPAPPPPVKKTPVVAKKRLVTKKK
jgi:hypothetical protein